MVRIGGRRLKEGRRSRRNIINVVKQHVSASVKTGAFRPAAPRFSHRTVLPQYHPAISSALQSQSNGNARLVCSQSGSDANHTIVTRDLILNMNFTAMLRFLATTGIRSAISSATISAYALQKCGVSRNAPIRPQVLTGHISPVPGVLKGSCGSCS